jgi:glycosyltransferase involved in cell wall biosynthesis
MRILCFLPDLGGGGAQRTLINLAASFKLAGHDVILGAAQADGPARAWIDASVEMVAVGSGQLRNALFPLAKLLRERRPDVVLSSVLDANIVAAAARVFAGTPRSGLVVRETNSQRARDDIGAVRRRLARHAYRSADAVVALSEGVRRELIEDFALRSDRVVTIHNPVEFDTLVEEAKAAPPPPAKKDGLWIMGVGRLLRQKGYDRLIRAVASLQRPDVRLVLVGEGPDRAALQTQADELGIGDRLIMPGFVRQPMQWLAAADLFVLSSRWEGFGHVIVEAMAAGAPVIAFDCPHGPRDIIRNGENGILVPDADETALTAAISELLDNRDRAMAFATRAKADAVRFSSATIAAQYLKLFAGL